MKAKKHLLLLLTLLLLAGCSMIGGPTAKAGQKIGKAGTFVIVLSGVNVVLIPVGLALGVPLVVVALPIYYGGCALAGEEPESAPFDL